MFEAFCIGSLIVVIIFLAKEGVNAYPIIGGLVVVGFIILLIKSCNDLQTEEEERIEYSRQRSEKLRKEMKETEYMRTEEYQKEQYRKKYRHEE